MSISARQRELERRAVADFGCPDTMCRVPAGEPCWSPRVWREGWGWTTRRPLVHPHKVRQALVPDWTQGRKSFGEMMSGHRQIPRPDGGRKTS